ncbi:MAG: hypothetical protein B6D39_03230 [Anaerolineae bacterium UTCFX2]|jgi:glycosyltransferase involved in cell wall biosynthesis|nr:glycosyltransferase [Anaerolineae bacterium]MCZ7552284.1 glycosyltransferase [Anaerolineales bacterium]OQY93272.1 MAG: hypothetical protein B6D39_03230 [Anaerolineae bacterium UTCFX2]
MKILLVANGMPPSAFGGVETYTSDLARALHQAGHTVSVFCRESDFSAPDYTVRDEIEEGKRLIRVVNDYKQIVSFRETFLDPHIEQIFQAALEEIRPDVIHFQHLIALSARLPDVAAAQNIPFITTLHDFWALCQRINLFDWRDTVCPGPQQGGDCYICTRGGAEQPGLPPAQSAPLRLFKRLVPPAGRRRIRGWFFPRQEASRQPPALASSRQVFEERYAVFKRSLLLSAGLLAPSAYVREQYIANGYPQEIAVLPLGINPPDPTEPASTGGPLVFGAIGSVIPIKGFDRLIQAFRAVRQADVRLHIYGRQDIAPAYMERLTKLIDQDERIRFMGPFPPDQRSQVYRQIDALVIPSIVPETFSLVAREALLHHKPVIASRLGALGEVVSDRQNGFLFSSNDPDELTRILSSIAADPETLQALKLPGPFLIYSFTDHLQKLEELYSHLHDR